VNIAKLPEFLRRDQFSSLRVRLPSMAFTASINLIRSSKRAVPRVRAS
jgi:hypothetical protein